LQQVAAIVKFVLESGHFFGCHAVTCVRVDSLMIARILLTVKGQVA
jgi:hypothetical protein